MSKLRILQVIVQPQLVWDDGDTLTPGPDIQPITVPLTQLADLAERIPVEIERLEREQSNAKDAE